MLTAISVGHIALFFAVWLIAGAVVGMWIARWPR
jgi:uncharacterized protein YneF (UPF0154 family)